MTSLLKSVGAALGENRTVEYNCDVFVNGATMGGIFAAIAVKRSGYSVVIIEQHPYHIGGMSTGGLSHNDTPSSPSGLWPLCLDFYTRAAAVYDMDIDTFMGVSIKCSADPSVFMDILRNMLAENDVTVLNGLRVESVTKTGLYIQNVVLTNGAVVRAKRYIDSTYEGDLMTRAGCSYTWGREANATYTETNNGGRVLSDLVVGFPISPYVVDGDATSGLLPSVVPTATAVGEADKRVVGYNYRLNMTKGRDRIPPWDPPEYDPLDYEYLGRLFAAGAITGASSIFTINPLISGHFDFNSNGAIGTNIFGETYKYPYLDYASRDEFNERLKNYILGLFKFIRDDSRIDTLTKNEVATYGFTRGQFDESNGFPPCVYVRESARLVGDFVLTEPMVSDASLLDVVAYSAYNLDSHYVSLVASANTLQKEGSTAGVAIGYYYVVPYRALQPKATECKNLLVTFCISATHIMFSGARMEYVHMGVGEAAGYAAALSIQQQKDFADLHVSYVQNAVELNPVGVLMDALAPSGNGTVTTVGVWTTATNQYGKEVWGQNFVSDGAALKGTKTVKFQPTLPAGGSYEIWVKFRDINDASRANNVPYTVQRSGGTSTGTFSQKLPGAGVNGFLSIGTFTLVGDGSDYFQIETTGTAGGTQVCADAVVFQPKFDIL